MGGIAPYSLLGRDADDADDDDDAPVWHKRSCEQEKQSEQSAAPLLATAVDEASARLLRRATQTAMTTTIATSATTPPTTPPMSAPEADALGDDATTRSIGAEVDDDDDDDDDEAVIDKAVPNKVEGCVDNEDVDVATAGEGEFVIAVVVVNGVVAIGAICRCFITHSIKSKCKLTSVDKTHRQHLRRRRACVADAAPRRHRAGRMHDDD